MRILVTGNSMSYLSGQPLYCYELCRELRKLGHEITMMSAWDGPLTGRDGYLLKEGLLEVGVKILDWNAKLNEEYDFVIASEIRSEEAIKQLPRTPVINVVHSEYDCETPLADRPQIFAYVCIRESIVSHIISNHGIPASKCSIIGNGIDLERFKPREKKENRNFYKVVVPGTLDPLREKFLNRLIDSASEERRIFFFGINCGVQLHRNPWVIFLPDKFNIEFDIADADEVAGILLGRTTLEAWACNVSASIWNPETLEYEIKKRPDNFEELYDIKIVTNKLLEIYRKYVSNSHSTP